MEEHAPTPTVCYRTSGLRSRASTIRAQITDARDISEQSSEMAAGRLADDGMMARVEACPTACLGDGMNMATGSRKLDQKNCCRHKIQV
jgi:hypothetical protein